MRSQKVDVLARTGNCLNVAACAFGRSWMTQKISMNGNTFWKSCKALVWSSKKYRFWASCLWTCTLLIISPACFRFVTFMSWNRWQTKNMKAYITSLSRCAWQIAFLECSMTSVTFWSCHNTCNETELKSKLRPFFLRELWQKENLTSCCSPSLYVIGLRAKSSQYLTVGSVCQFLFERVKDSQQHYVTLWNQLSASGSITKKHSFDQN